MLNHVRSWLYVDHLSRPIKVLDGLPGLYGLKYDSATVYGPPLYLCSYKLVGSVTAGIRARFNIKHVLRLFKTKAFVVKMVFQLIVIYKCSKIKIFMVY